MAAFRSERSVRKPYSRPASRGADGRWFHDKTPTGPANRAARPPPPAVVNSKIVVSNLHYEITPKDLAAIFGHMGTLVREPLIRYDRSGRSTGIAIISFEKPAEATRAMNQFDGILAKGQPMSIAYDTMPPRPARRSASAPQSLLNRIQKPPLLDRLSRGDAVIKAAASTPKGAVPIRPRAGGLRPRRESKKIKTAEELDKELDAFMGDSESTSQANAPATATLEDVEMS